MAEILLHPEARSSGVTLVKTMHVIRAVEYSDATMDQLPSDSYTMSVGSFPESEAETELQYETEWEPTTPMAAEFPILTLSFFDGYLSTMSFSGQDRGSCGGQAFDAKLSAHRSLKPGARPCFNGLVNA